MAPIFNPANFVHRINNLVQPRLRLFIVQERVKQATLVILARDAHRAQDVQVAHAAAVHFHPHSK